MNEEQTNETNRIENTDPVEDTAQGYIQAIAEMKQNSVSRDSYNKLKEDNKQLLEALINGGQIDIPTAEEQTISAQEAIDNFHQLAGRKKGKPLDHEFANEWLKMRGIVLEEKGDDVFLPSNPTDADYKNAADVEAFLSYLVEVSDGNNEVFEREMNRHLVEYPALPTKNKRR